MQEKGMFGYCFTYFLKVQPDIGIVNLEPRNQLVSKNLIKFAQNETTAFVNIDNNLNNSELKNLTLVVRKKFTSSIVLAADFSDFQNDNFRNKSEKICLVTEKLKNGYLILLLFKASFKRDESRFLTKTIIITGKQNF